MLPGKEESIDSVEKSGQSSKVSIHVSKEESSSRRKAIPESKAPQKDDSSDDEGSDDEDSDEGDSGSDEEDSGEDSDEFDPDNYFTKEEVQKILEERFANIDLTEYMKLA